jgi:hypothetical protein
MTNDELIKKWKTLLDYTDDEVLELNEFQRLYRATLMENCEINYFKYNGIQSDSIAPKELCEMICEIRGSG